MTKSQKKILVCDDDEGIVEVMRIILEDNGYQVKTLSNGKAIHKKTLEYCPDIIFLDIWMPGIDGREVTKLLKNDQQTAELPIVVISALNDTKKIAHEVGADDFLEKPFDMTDLLDMVEKYTSKPKQIS